MSDCSNSVDKYVIVQTPPDQGIYTGLTITGPADFLGPVYMCSGSSLTLHTITGCTSGVTINGNFFSNGGDIEAVTVITTPHINANIISGGTLYGDGSNLVGITDSYLTGGTYNNGIISFSGGGDFNNFSIDVTPLLDNTDNFVTGGTYSNGFINFSGTSNQQSFSIDVTPLLDDTNTFITGGTLTSGNTLDFTYNNGLSLPPIDLTSIKYTGNTADDCITDLYVSNIHSCSPLHINPEDEGKIFFGSTTGITIDVTNPSISIGGEDVSDNTTLQLWTDGSGQRALRMRDKVTNSQFNMWTTTASTGENILKIDEDTFGSTVLTLYRSGKMDVDRVNLNGLTANTIQVVLEPTVNNNNTQILSRNSSTGDIEYTTLASITGATSGDSYTTLAYLSGDTIVFDNNSQGSNFYNVDLSPLLDLKTDLTTFNTYTANTETLIGTKTNLSDFSTHTGDTTIHFTKGDINLNELGSTAHTHTLGEITDFSVYSGDTDNKINTKLDTSLFNSHTGDTNNPHQTTFNDLVSTGHTHTISDITNLQTELDSKLNITDFNTYSGNVQTELNTKISGATNLSSEGIFAQKNGLNLEFKGLTSTGGTVDISSNSNTVNLEVTIPADQDKFVSGGTYNTGTQEINFVGNSPETTFDVDLSSIISVDTYVTGFTFNPSTYDLTIKQNEGQPDLVANLAVLASDVYVVSGVYNPSTGIVTYTNSSGGTFQVSGFTTGMTDSYTTSAVLNGETIEFNNNIQGSNLYNVSLSPVLSGKTDLTLFNSHTGNTTIHFTKSSINLSDLGNTAHTHTLSEITDFNIYSGSVQTQIDSKLNISDFNTYSGNVQTQLDSKIDNGINSGGANEVFSGKSGNDLYFRTLSGGTNTTISTIDDVIRVDVSIPVDTNTYVTGFTYDDVNTFTISRNGGLGDLTSTISVLSGITYYGDGSNLSGISTDNFYVTGGTYIPSASTITLDRNDGNTVSITGITTDITGVTLNSGQILVGSSGNTSQAVSMTGDVNIDNTGVTTIQPDSVTYDKMQDVSQAAMLGNTNSSGGTVSEIPILEEWLSAGAITTLLEDTTNWDINGNYTGTTITGTYQSQKHYNNNYLFMAVDDNLWIRLIRG